MTLFTPSNYLDYRILDIFGKNTDIDNIWYRDISLNMFVCKDQGKKAYMVYSRTASEV